MQALIAYDGQRTGFLRSTVYCTGGGVEVRTPSHTSARLGAHTPWHARMGNNSQGDTERVHIGGDEDET